METFFLVSRHVSQTVSVAIGSRPFNPDLPHEAHPTLSGAVQVTRAHTVGQTPHNSAACEVLRASVPFSHPLTRAGVIFTPGFVPLMADSSVWRHIL